MAPADVGDWGAVCVAVVVGGRVPTTGADAVSVGAAVRVVEEVGPLAGTEGGVERFGGGGGGVACDEEVVVDGWLGLRVAASEAIVPKTPFCGFAFYGFGCVNSMQDKSYMVKYLHGSSPEA